MNPITAIIADDEAELRRHLIKLLNQLWPDLVIAGESGSGPGTLDLFHRVSPDIVFLDINMPGLTGLEVARQISQQCTIVFITAYDQYAIDAFENEALDYILKPIPKERLLTTIERCKRRFESPATGQQDIGPLLLHLEKSLLKNRPSPFLQWIRARQGETIRLIPVADVRVFKSDDKYTRVITSQSESLIRKPIRELELELDPEIFWKINRGAIINVRTILKISRSVTGKYVIKLDGHDDPLLVSRSFSHLFRQM